MKNLLLLISGIFLSSMLWADELPDSLKTEWKDYWTLKGRAYIHVSQGAQFNWAKEGESVFSTLIKTQVDAQYKKDKQIWDNQLKWNYGFLYVGLPKEERLDYRKSDDYFELNSSFGHQATGSFYYNGLFNFKTQFFRGYKYPDKEKTVTNFLSPAYVIFSIGMNYKPNDRLKIMLSPLTSKSTIVAKEGDGKHQVDGTKFGLDEGERILREIGAYLTFYHKVKLYTDVDMENNLTLFSNYEYKPENVDVELKSDINFKVNKYIKAIISLHFIYDDDASIPINEFDDNGVYKGTRSTVGLQFQEKVMIGVGIDF